MMKLKSNYSNLDAITNRDGSISKVRFLASVIAKIGKGEL